MAEDELYRLEPRQATDNDRVWLGIFSAGNHYWEEEVTTWLRDDAVDAMKAGYNTTTIYSFPEEPAVVGYMTTAGESWSLKKVENAFPNWEQIEGLPEKIPVVLIVYFGVSAKFQGQGFGSEIFVRLLESLPNNPVSARFVYLQVWADNEGAIRFYEEFGFKEFEREDKDRPDGNGQAALVKMAYDRYALPEEPD